MFFWKKNNEHEKALAEAERQGAFSLAQKIKDWHVTQKAQQLALETEFDLKQLSELKINIWDEINDGSTYGYVDMSKVPDGVCFEVLYHLMTHIRANGIQNVFMRYFDSTTVWPINLMTETGTLMSFRRWELYLQNVDYSSLDEIVEVAKKVPPFLGTRFRVISVS